MSQTPTASTSSSNYQSIFDNAIEAYKKKTKKDLRSHPLLNKLQNCDSPDAVLSILYEQIPGFDQSCDTDDKLTKWLDPTVNVLCTFSGVIGGSIGLVFQPAAVIFTGIGVLLSAAKAVSDSQGVLATVFERIENFFRRLETYIQVPPTTGMTDIIVKIMVEVLSILSIATKEIKQGSARKYVKKLVGRTDIEDALNRLDRLTQDEVRMAAAQGLKATHEVDNKVKTVEGKVQGVDDRVRDVDDKIDLIIDGSEKIREEVKQVAYDMGDQKRNQIRQDLRNWLSPPDPSINFNTANDSHHEGTALWFIEGSTFKDWKASGSLLWLHGKPGSGKSVLSSSIIQDIKSVCNAGSAHIAYFFFDYKDKGKQDARALLSSFLVQLSHQSTSLCDVLFGYHSFHQSGSQQPSDRTLIECLENMLKASGRVPIYLIIDALDECPNTDKLPPPRERVLELIEKLVKLGLPKLRLCITSRPEVDIRVSLEPLTTMCISLHDQIGQKKDIEDYVRSVVYSDKNMRRWRDEDKKLVIETLTEKADGMFRWVFCQLAILRPCLPPSVRPILSELPETLDETYERILQEIPKSNRVYAHRLLQCLTVAVRPLCVEELAEVLAVDLDATGGIPKLNEDLRWEDQEQAVLSACSSLVAAVWDGGLRVVQFSHFSVKEFLTSGRLTTSTIVTSHHYHILLEPSHTIMAQACLSVLLRLDSYLNKDSLKDCPLARYASEHFGDHAEFGNVFPHIRDGIDDLLNTDKPHFAAWLWVREGGIKQPPERPEASSLYHVAGLGFRAMVDYLISKRPADLGVRGSYGVPLHASLHNGHADVALLLLGHCVDMDVRGIDNRTPLHMAADCGLLEVTRILIERGANINARDSSGRTPLHPISIHNFGTFDDAYSDVVRYLLEHGIDVDTQADIEHSTPLHLALYWGGLKVVQLLLDHGADINIRDKNGRTPLHGTLDEMKDDLAYQFFDAVRFLLEHGADVHALDNDHATPLHVVSVSGGIKAARLLLDHGAFVEARNNKDSTPLHVASQHGNTEVARLLLEHGANIHVRNKEDQIPQHQLLAMWSKKLLDDDIDAIRIVLESGADVDSFNDGHSALLHAASFFGSVKVAQLLLDHGANINVQNGKGQTPLHRALDRDNDGMYRMDEIPQDFFHVTSFLVECGADVHALDNNHLTALHFASRCGNTKAARVLLEHGAVVDVRDNNHSTPLHIASQRGNIEAARLLIEYGANIHALDGNNLTPLHFASESGNDETARLLLEHGADVHALNKNHSTPLHFASESGNAEAARLLLEHGADVHALDNNHSTPLHFISQHGGAGAARVLLGHGAVVDARDNKDSTPLHVASRCGNVEVSSLLLEHGANIHTQNKEGQAPRHLLLAMWSGKYPDDYVDTIRFFLERGADVGALDDNHSALLHAASRYGSDEVVQLLLDRDANVNARSVEGQTPLHQALLGSEFHTGNRLFDVIRLLLEHGANVDALDNEHSTPLHVASKYGNIKATRLLLKHGAVVDLQDNDGQTPSQVASANGHEEVARLLSEHLQSEKKV